VIWRLFTNHQPGSFARGFRRQELVPLYLVWRAGLSEALALFRHPKRAAKNDPSGIIVTRLRIKQFGSSPVGLPFSRLPHIRFSVTRRSSQDRTVDHTVVESSNRDLLAVICRSVLENGADWNCFGRRIKPAILRDGHGCEGRSKQEDAKCLNGHGFDS
jgi:hypothetical protein